ncbi:hypothetical protein CPC08DRAFT_736537 [Agrocybe pediades]|nr:hypothetical protein CPC08DRAFT_736537 [Agrocybe pediades]
MQAAETRQEVFVLEKSLSTPAHISSLTFGHAGHLFAGSDDGSLRVYDLSSFKVLKAIRGLGAEVSSIICVKRPGSELRDAWIAHGKTISKFQLASEKMIQSPEDALVTLAAGDEENDILNELALNADKSNLAFSLDSGVVGVVDLVNDNTITRMEEKHTSVCGSVKYVPDRPRELISGGYDTFLFHFDTAQNKVISHAFAATNGMALSPPFIMSLAVSVTGVLAAGTADGRLWIGFGGEKSPNTTAKSSKKKAKKWDGLNEDESLLIKVAEGPIVAMAFTGPRRLTTSTLMGVITQYLLIYEEGKDSVLLQQLWQKESTGLEKVNALVADEKRIIVGGFSSKGLGVIEIWKQDVPVPEKVAELQK